MKLYHASPAEHHASIARHGLDPLFAQTRAKVVWLVKADLQQWAAKYCRTRHDVPDNMPVLLYRVEVDRLDVECAGDGRYWSYHAIDPDKITVVAQYGPGNIIIA